MTPVLAFDIETVPDVAGIRRLHDLPADLPDSDVAEIAFQKRRVQTGNDFLPPHLQRVIVISCVMRTDEGLQVFSIGEPERDERLTLEKFFSGIDKLVPQLVSWNGGGFDLPVLNYRALIHGVAAPKLWDQGEDDREFKFNSYLGRYHSRHLDLMDVLAMYQPRNNAPLDEVAQLAGLPGKIGVGGAQVWSAYLAGRIGEIRSYCEVDTANTYLLYLRFQLLRGAISAEQYVRECGVLRGLLEKRAEPHWQEFLKLWEDLTLSVADELLSIDSLDAEGRGVARNAEGKVVFVEGALPGERAAVRIFQKKAKYDTGRATSLFDPAAGRREPRCPHFGVCGGCATQHADERTQMAAKQRWLEDCLERIGRVEPETLLPIVYGPEWGYRHRARFSARHLAARGAMVGFRERRSTHVAEMTQCHVLPEKVSQLIPALRSLIGSLSIRERVPQIEVAVGDNATVLVFRHLLPLAPEDEAALRAFAEQHGVHVWLQPGGPDSARPFHPAQSELHYELPEFGVRIGFRPTEFTQVNFAMNRVLVSRALQLLEPHVGERVADLFCGLGNFSLPLAAKGAHVVGFEGSAALVERARQNAAANGLVAQFEAIDLFKTGIGPFGPFQKLLIDPPREGAIELIKSLPDAWPQRIVYVSCDPATLARDAGVLVHTKGFRLAAAGVVNMFPHTAHVESVGLFER